MKKVKYLAQYSGPSYGWFDSEFMIGLSSITEGKWVYTQFQRGWAYRDEYRMNANGVYVPWEISGYVQTPGTTESDVLYIHSVTYVDGFPVAEDASHTVFLGPRGGLKVEAWR